VAGAVYLFGIKHFHLAVAREIFEIRFVREYLFDEKFRRVVRLMDEEESQRDDAFAAVWESGRWLFSRKLFRPVEMYGVQRYMYKPGVTRVSFTITVGGQPRSFEMVDTPELRRAIADLHPDDVRAIGYDELGFRPVDAELRRDCAVRVMFLGDSFTEGLFVDDAETFVNRYGHLARDRGRVAACPIDAGVDGYSTLEEAYVFAHYWEAVGRPRVAVLMHFVNDIDELPDKVLDGTMTDPSRKWADNFSYLRRMVAFARQHGVDLVVAAIPIKRQATEPSTLKNYQDILRRFCDKEGVRFIDLNDTLRAYDPAGVYVKGDIHWNAKGHGVVADVLYERTKDLLVAASTSAASPPRARTKS